MKLNASEFICVGRVKKTQGNKGEVKASIVMDDPSLIQKFDKIYLENGEVLNLSRVFRLGEDFGLGFAEIKNMGEADKLKNQNLYLKREEIEKFSSVKGFYIADILGKRAVFENGEEVGTIADIENYGAADVVFIKSKKYPNLSFANTGGIMLKVDSEKNEVLIDRKRFFETAVYDKEGEDSEN